MVIGIIALQGNFEEHQEILDKLHTKSILVKSPEQLEKVNGIILPGGESTAQGKLLAETGLEKVLWRRIKEGLPVYGTCAGALLLAKKVIGGNSWFQLMNITIERNAYGSQYESFNDDISIDDIGVVHGVFIRAPIIRKCKAQVLATYKDNPVAVRQDNMLVTTFHPELADEKHVHEYFLKMVK